MQQRLFLFPGVGSHHSGMGKTFYEQFQGTRDVFAEASDILHRDMGQLCFAPEEASALDQLEHAQAALVCVSVAAYRALVEETGLEQAFYLGYSLGEYSALCCAGALTLRDTLLLIQERGKILTEVAASLEGSMVWVVNIEVGRVEAICEALRQEGEALFISAYDSPVKVSISGTTAALHKAGEQVVAAGGIPIPIKMSGPFHSPLMQAAANRLQDILVLSTCQTPRFPVLSNVTAQPYVSGEDVASKLSVQLVSPIRWSEALHYAAERGVNTSIEIGPKNVLTYLLSKNMSGVTTYTLDTAQALSKLKAKQQPVQEAYTHLLSKCLTTIVGTKNRNSDEQAYEEKVVKTFRKLQKTYEDIRDGKITPDASLPEEAINLVTEALLVKGMSRQEVAARIEKILH